MGDVFAVEQDLSGIRRHQAKRIFQHDGLSGARSAKNDKRIAWRNIDIHAPQDLIGPKAFLDAFELEDGLGHGLDPYPDEESGKHVIAGQNEYGRADHGQGRCPPDARRAGLGF